MPTPKPRSAFLPIMLIIVGLVVCAGVVASVPLVECGVCLGVGGFTRGEFVTLIYQDRDVPIEVMGIHLTQARIDEKISVCDWFAEKGRISLFRKWVMKKTNPGWRDYVETDRRIRENRQSTP